MKTYLWGFMLIFICSCHDFLTESSQDLSYVRTYSDLDEVLVGNGYMDFNSDKDYFPYLHLIADECKENNTNGVGNGFNLDYSNARNEYYGLYTWQLKTNLSFDKLSTYDDETDWNHLYNHINIINMILNQLKQYHSENEKEKMDINRIHGEAYFLRAAYYFILVNLYGKPFCDTSVDSPAVPIKLTEYIEDIKFGRNTVGEIYQQIINDLEMAIKYLKLVPHKSNYRADLTASYTLLGRVYLYMQDFENSIKYSSIALEIKNDLVDLNTFPKNEAFINKNGVETIFTMGPNKLTDYINIYYEGFGVNTELVDLYENSDLRKQLFFYDNNGAYLGEYLLRKYFIISNSIQTLPDVSDCFIIRTPEIYLNLAEAYCYIKNDVLARKFLDELRIKRHTIDGFIPTNEKGEELADKIRLERRLELCFEGHRWFDLRRYAVNRIYPHSYQLKNEYSLFSFSYDYFDFIRTKTYVYKLTMSEKANTLPIPFGIANYNDMTNNERDERIASEIIEF